MTELEQDQTGRGTHGTAAGRRSISRRSVLAAGGAALIVGAAGVAVPVMLRSGRAVGPDGPEVAATERERRRTGRLVTLTLPAAPATIDLGGRTVRTWIFGDSLPGPAIRANVGDELRVTLVNELPAETSVHWHGLALRNDMDGVPGLTTEPIAPASRFDYSFVVPHPGTYWFHPHVGVQLDTGLYAPLIVDDPAEPDTYDEEAVVVLDDWTDGWGDSPDQILADARRNGMGGMSGMDGMDGMEGMGMPSPSEPLGSDTGDVKYPAHLINGRLPTAPYLLASRPGRRIRLRIINAASDTSYRFAIGGHALTITHTDGFPIDPVEVDTLIIGMGERYDVVVRARDGAFPIVAVPEGKKDPAAVAHLKTASGSVPTSSLRPSELTGRRLDYVDMAAAEAVALGAGSPDRELEMVLTMADGGRQWLINGRPYQDTDPLPVKTGERVRLVLRNQSMMFHPMHLHGHTFALERADGRGIRKDTVNVLPMQQLAVDLIADNPGQWLAHCHNAYHAELGMMTTLSYRT